MLSDQAESLLPFATKIDHFGKSLILKEKIGEGYTSIVYKGELHSEDQIIPVAVKACKELDIPGARENFRQEAITLRKFMEFEDQINKKMGIDGLRVAPIFWGKNEYKNANREIDYIVMELIQGREIPALLQERRTMSEQDALVATWQFFRVLDILHTQFQKVFIDLKIREFMVGTSK